MLVYDSLKKMLLVFAASIIYITFLFSQPALDTTSAQVQSRITLSNLTDVNEDLELFLINEQDSLDLARKLMIAKRSKSAIAITGPLLKKLQEQGRYSNYFGLQTRLVHGSALIHARMDRTPFEFLWRLKDESKAAEAWDVFAESCRVIASILAYSGRPEQSLENLREAQSTIRLHKLDSVYAHFAVRISSWHRNFGSRDSSIFYAKEAIRVGKEFGQVFEQAEGHLLLALNYRESNPDTATNFYTNGARLYKAIGEYTTFCSMYMGLAKLAVDGKRPQDALPYLDTVALYLPIAEDNNIRQRHRLFQLKGTAYQQLNQLDSAIYYLDRGHTIELEAIKAENLEKVVEIDNKYNVEKKIQELETQKKEVQRVRERTVLLVTLIALTLLFSGALIFYLFKLRKANRLTLEQAEQLRNLDVAKTRFFTNISHELRTPLTLMLGPISILLKEGGLTEKQDKLLKMANLNGRHLQDLLQDILDLRKLEIGKLKLEMEPTSVSYFVTQQAAMFDSLAERKQIQYSFISGVDQDVIAQIDREKCRQILNNLLSNAFKFTPVGGKIKGSLSQIGDQLELKVSDTGSGISADELPYIFDRFFQTNQQQKPIEGGTGIGLALCQQYAQLFNGKLEVVSVAGEGSEFILRFPLLLAEGQPYVDSPIPEPEKAIDGAVLGGSVSTTALEGTSSRPLIMVVEDNYQLQDYIRLILQDQYDVVAAENGTEAIEKLRKATAKIMTEEDAGNQESTRLPDLILSDLMMPVMDGFQLLSQLKQDQDTRHLPVVMLTARAEQRDKLKALRIGVDDYLTKPFDAEELLVRIENLLKNRANRVEVEPVNTEPLKITPKISQEDLQWLESFEAYVLQHYTDSSISIPSLADEFAMSQSTLLRQLKRLTGLTPIRYLQEVRMHKALQLLEDRTYDSINRIAYEVGYRDTRAFSRNFKKRYGKFPSEA